MNGETGEAGHWPAATGRLERNTGSERVVRSCARRTSVGGIGRGGGAVSIGVKFSGVFK